MKMTDENKLALEAIEIGEREKLFGNILFPNGLERALRGNPKVYSPYNDIAGKSFFPLTQEYLRYAAHDYPLTYVRTGVVKTSSADGYLIEVYNIQIPQEFGGVVRGFPLAIQFSDGLSLTRDFLFMHKPSDLKKTDAESPELRQIAQELMNNPDNQRRYEDYLKEFDCVCERLKTELPPKIPLRIWYVDGTTRQLMGDISVSEWKNMYAWVDTPDWFELIKNSGSIIDIGELSKRKIFQATAGGFGRDRFYIGKGSVYDLIARSDVLRNAIAIRDRFNRTDTSSEILDDLIAEVPNLRAGDADLKMTRLPNFY